ncbi:MAG: hypothetical protein K2X76_07070 [Sphingomonas sp.]|nr:hypothetical protein [Sphingomonas sp.]
MNDRLAASSAKPLARPVRWTPTLKNRFLDHLAASGDVQAAAAAIGVDPATAYALHRRDAKFREAWQEAIVAGYQLLETRLIGHALAGGGEALPGVAGAPPVSTQLALQLLQLHRGALKAPRPAKATRPPSPEETDAAILKKLAAIERRQACDKS